MNGQHRAPPPPPLLARLNEPTPLRFAVLALATFGTFALGVAGIADGIGDGITPARASAALPTRDEEPTGRGGPLAPVFDDVDAPDYPIGDGLPVSTPQGRRVVVTQRPVIATKSPLPAQNPVPSVPGPPEPAPVQQAPAEPEPVVGLPDVETAEPTPPAPTEEAPVTETEPTVVVEPTATPEPTPIEETP